MSYRKEARIIRMSHTPVNHMYASGAQPSRGVPSCASHTLSHIRLYWNRSNPLVRSMSRVAKILTTVLSGNTSTSSRRAG